MYRQNVNDRAELAHSLKCVQISKYLQKLLQYSKRLPDERH